MSLAFPLRMAVIVSPSPCQLHWKSPNKRVGMGAGVDAHGITQMPVMSVEVIMCSFRFPCRYILVNII